MVISSRHDDELRPAPTEIPTGTAAAGKYVAADMTARDDVHRLAGDRLEELGQVDILVNNAGINVPQPIDQISDEDWDRLWR